MRERLATQPLSRRNRQNLRARLAALLAAPPERRGELIRELLAQALPEGGKEPSPRETRLLCAAIMEQLVGILRAATRSGGGELLRFFRYLDHFPLARAGEAQAALSLVQAEAPGEEGRKLFTRLQLFWLLTLLGDAPGSRSLRVELESLVAPDRPRLHAIYQLSLARKLQRRGRRIGFCALWLELICHCHSLDGPDTALYLILRWIRMLNWGRDTAPRARLLQKFGAPLRLRRDLLSATLLGELFLQEQSPAARMRHARLLLRQPSSLLTVRQLQNLHFFAGTYLSAVKSRFLLSIREYKHSNYYLHKTWLHLQNQSRFLRANLTAGDYARLTAPLQQQLVELGSRISLQNNAYVETLRENYSTIKDLLRRVEQLSLTDNLTGLRNRRFLAHNLEQSFQLAARHRVPVCLAILDIDGFKGVNDARGHLAGDQVLKGLAKILLSFFRKSDVVIRWGGDEFLLILFDVAPDRAEQLLDELGREVSGHLFPWPDGGIRITVSIGWTPSDQAALSPAKLHEAIARVDAALYAAKNSGRGQVVRAAD